VHVLKVKNTAILSHTQAHITVVLKQVYRNDGGDDKARP